MDSSHLAILLLLIGLAFIIAEFFIPSGGMITVMAIVSLVSSVWFAWQAWGGSAPRNFYLFVTALVLSLPTVLVSTLWVLSNTRLGNRVLLEAPTPQEVAPYQQEQMRLQQLVGQRGQTLTLLNPGGLVLVQNERVHSETPGLMLDAGVDVEVIAVKGTRIVVRPVGEPQTTAAGEGDAARAESKEPSPLDFEFGAE